MKRQTLLTLFLTLILLFALAVSAEAAGTSPSDAEPIALGEIVNETFTEDEDGFIIDYERYFKITPTETAYYEIAVNNPVDNNVRVAVNDSKGEYVCFASYNKYTGEQIAVEKLQANNTYYIVLYCDSPRTVGLSITKHKHTLKVTDLSKAYVNSDYSLIGDYVLDCTRCDYFEYKTIPAVNTIKLSATKFVVDGKVKKVVLTVKDKTGKALKNGTDYTVSGTLSSKNVGIYNVKVTFKGNYTGSRTLTWQIAPQAPKKLKATSTVNKITLTWAKVDGATSYIVYDEFGVQLATVKTNKAVIKKLFDGWKYNFYVCAVVKSGGKNVYSAKTGIKTATKPYTPKDIEALGKKGKATVKFNEQYGVSGYEIYMAKGKNGKYKLVSTVKPSKNTYRRSATVNKLSKRTTYYFKVRSYIKNGNTVVYSNFSKPASAKVK